MLTFMAIRTDMLKDFGRGDHVCVLKVTTNSFINERGRDKCFHQRSW
jgi:hypothetical protein